MCKIKLVIDGRTYEPQEIPDLQFEIQEMLHSEIKNQQQKIEILTKALEFIDDVAEPMHRYNELELKMVLAAREALKKIGEL